jgi:hypothetical protein
MGGLEAYVWINPPAFTQENLNPKILYGYTLN